VRATDEFGARVGDTGASRLRDNTDAMALEERFCQCLDLMRLRVLVKHLEGELSNDTIWTEKFNKASRGFLLFDDEVRDRSSDGSYDWRKR
jgi:hypothetical protein